MRVYYKEKQVLFKIWSNITNGCDYTNNIYIK